MFAGNIPYEVRCYGNSPIVIGNQHDPKNLPNCNIKNVKYFTSFYITHPAAIGKYHNTGLTSRREERCSFMMKNIILLCFIVVCSAGRLTRKLLFCIFLKVERSIQWLVSDFSGFNSIW